MTIRRIAVVNRGAAAVRLIQAVRERALELDTDLTAIAFYTDEDRGSLFVREADERYPIGPATVAEPGSERRISAYLALPVLQDALVRSRADAAWVGWGYNAENADFAAMCQDLGITFIGAPATVLRRLRDTISAKRLAEAVGIPVAPWSGRPVDSADAAGVEAARLGYPVMLKAASGSGGRGVQQIDNEGDLAVAFARARDRARALFGDPAVFLEATVPSARQVEVQLAADRVGTVWALGVRDSSVQQRHRKVFDEAPSPVLTAEQDAWARDAAVRVAREAGFQGVGSVEFLSDTASGRLLFLEFNARLQAAHPVTEVTTGLDLVQLALHLADGGLLEGEPPECFGHAIGARLLAEDPDHEFRATPGRIELLRFPGGPGLRVDAAVEEGDPMPPVFEPVVATVVAHGHDRTEALARLRRALSESSVVLEDGATSRAFLQALADRPELRSNDIDTAWVDRLLTEGRVMPRTGAAIALCESAIRAYQIANGYERDHFFASAVRGRPEVAATVGHHIALRHEGERYELRVLRMSREEYVVECEGSRIVVQVHETGPTLRRLEVGGRTYRVLTVDGGHGWSVEVDGVPHHVASDDGGVVRAEAPGVVVSLLVKAGDTVAAGDRLAVVEAMKMESPIVSESDGRIRSVLVRTHQQVSPGEALMILEDQQLTTPAVDAVRVSFAYVAGVTPDYDHHDCRHRLAELRRMVMGYDVSPDDLSRRTKAEPCPERSLSDEERRPLEAEVLEVFVDAVALYSRGLPTDQDAPRERRSTAEYFFGYLRDPGAAGRGLPESFLSELRRLLAHYGVESLQPSHDLRAALFRMAKSGARMEHQTAPVVELLQRRLDRPASYRDESWRQLLDRIIAATHGRLPAVHDLALEVRSRTFDLPMLEEIRSAAHARARRQIVDLAADPDGPLADELVAALVECPQPLKTILSESSRGAPARVKERLLEVMTRRYYRIRPIREVVTFERDGIPFATTSYPRADHEVHVLSTHVEHDELEAAVTIVAALTEEVPTTDFVVVELYEWDDEGGVDVDGAGLAALLDRTLPPGLQRVVVATSGRASGPGISGVQHRTFRPGDAGYVEDRVIRGLHPMMGKRLHLARLANFEIERLPSVEDVYLFHGVARSNPRDERLFVLAEVRDLTPVRNADGVVVALPEFERIYLEAINALRDAQLHRPEHRRLHWNRLMLYVWPPIDLPADELFELVQRLAPETDGLGLEKVVIFGRQVVPGQQPRPVALDISNPEGRALVLRVRTPHDRPLAALTQYTQRVVQLRRRGLVYPYEFVRMLAPDSSGGGSGVPPGSFVELELDEDGTSLVPVEREPGANTANVVVGLITNVTEQYPEGMERVIVLGDPSRGMGSVAEPECRRIMAALSLAQQRGIPCEWIAVSAGALIAMDSGTENMDWISAVLRRIIEFTQAGGELNVVVAGINVGAQPYWNAEATMLMHTRGILVMAPESAMVLTGKQALDYSGGVSAEDNLGIGGYERVMGPNGQAQYFARDLSDACRVLLSHYEHTYVAPGERFPRRAVTIDPVDRDVCLAPHGGEFATVGDVFSEVTNPSRKKAFEIRRVMAATVDQDHPTAERWFGMEDAETAVVWDAHLGGYPVTLIGLESKPLPRVGLIPADGPDVWTSGTLFPMSSKKVARAVNATSGNRPLVVLANLSGFDGSPESMRRAQLEYGAEIGRAVVNFRGPIVFCVVSRYHGGAFVVFSAALNPSMEIAAVAGSHASVIGGAPAAAVVFARDVDKRTDADPRVVEVRERLKHADASARSALRREAARVVGDVRSEKLGQVAAEFDAIHDIDRALRVGSVHRIIDPHDLRPYLVDAVERGLARELERLGADPQV